MVDRTDIDALLIGALYGELTPADEARLTAHLESHPADRTALDDLTRTRAAIRDSRILTVQLEPPQAISALLLQAASRRAPRAVTDRGEPTTWFQRLVRLLVAHPAMAAAATLVLVITAAGSLYLRGTDQLARPEVAGIERVPPPSVPTSSPSGSMTESAPVAARAPEPAASAAAHAPGEPTSASAGSSGAPAAATGAYRARLDGAPGAGDGNAAGQDRPPAPQAPAAQTLDTDDLSVRDPYEKAKADRQGLVQNAELRKQGGISKEAPARAAKAETVRGIELRTPQPQLKDLAEEKPAAGRRERAGDVARDQRNAAVNGGGAPASPPASAPPPPPAPAPANAPAGRGAGPAGAPEIDAPAQAQSPAANAANEGKRAPAKPVNQQPPSSANNAMNAQGARNLGKTANAPGSENAASNDAKQAPADRTLLDWARKQREQVIAYVSANRCQEAASAAVEIYNRAPDYYNANVATDRQIKPCLQYVTSERERAERSRANKNAADVQQAAPTRK